MSGPAAAVTATRIEQIEPVWIPDREGWEYSYFLMTQQKDGVPFSFHCTIYKPNWDQVERGDGEHEYALLCLAGESRKIFADGTAVHFTPGTVVHLPRVYEYRHVVGPDGLQMVLACSPSREVTERHTPVPVSERDRLPPPFAPRD